MKRGFVGRCLPYGAGWLLWLALVLTSLVGSSATAWAQDSQPRVAVLTFSGKGSFHVRQRVVKVVTDLGYDVVSKGEVGLGSQPKPDAIKKAAATHSLQAVIGGRITRSKGRYVLALSIYGTADGAAAEKLEVASTWIPGLQHAVTTQLPKDLPAPLGRVAKAPKEPDEPTEEKPAEPIDETPAKPTEEKPEPRSKSASPKQPTKTKPSKARAEAAAADDDDVAPDPSAPRWLELTLGAGVFTRSLDYTGDITSRLRDYRLTVGPTAIAAVGLYPFSTGVLGHLGVVGQLRAGPTLVSTGADEQELDTQHMLWALGLRGRLVQSSSELGATLSYGQHSYTVAEQNGTALVPNVTYQFVRLGVDGELHFGRFLVGADAGYRYVLDAGDIASERWFPRATTWGVDAGLLAGFALTGALDLLIGGRLERYNHIMSSESGDAFIAGSAHDTLLTGWLGVRFSLRRAEAAR